MRRFILVILGAAMSFSAILWYYHNVTSNLPPPENKLPPSARILYSDETPMYISRSVWMNLEEVPQDFIRILLASEDRNFFRHAGVDIRGIIRALFIDLTTGKVVQGGSTITQQLARSLYLGFERSIERKIREIFIAYWLERIRSKEEILEMYINSAYVGNGLYGFGAASLYYFGKPIQKLSTPEMMVLVGIIKSPENLNPYKQPELAKKKARSVAKAALDAKVIDKSKYEEVLKEIENLKFKKPNFFIDEEVFWRIIEEAKEISGLSIEELRGGYEIVTTLNSGFQRILEKKIKDKMAFLAVNSVGKILAYKGKGVQFGRRQIGSAIKPIYYLYSILNGVKPLDLLPDVPIDISGWKPENFTKVFKGYSTVLNAVVWSRNVPSVFLFSEFGYDRIVNFMKKILRINGYYPNDLTISLGTLETSPEEIAKFYIAVANGGTVFKPTIIKEIRRISGGPIYTFIPRVIGEIPSYNLSSEKAILILKGILREVVRRGTGKRAKITGKEMFGKTGTAERNAWFIGGDDSVIMIMARDGKNLLGGEDVAPLWRDIVSSWGEFEGRLSYTLPKVGGKSILSVKSMRYIDFKRLADLLKSGRIPEDRLEKFLSNLNEDTYRKFLKNLSEFAPSISERLGKLVEELREWKR